MGVAESPNPHECKPHLENADSIETYGERRDYHLVKICDQYPSCYAKDFSAQIACVSACPRPNWISPKVEYRLIAGFVARGLTECQSRDRSAQGREIRANSFRGNHPPIARWPGADTAQ